MPYVITEACVDVMDRSCLEQCPVDCIREGVRMLYIDPQGCIDCAACEASCPQDAIYLDELVPSDLAQYVAVNTEFVSTSQDGGPNGGVVRDHPLVAALPPR